MASLSPVVATFRRSALAVPRHSEPVGFQPTMTDDPVADRPWDGKLLRLVGGEWGQPEAGHQKSQYQKRGIDITQYRALTSIEH